jgi:hypothetical protein
MTKQSPALSSNDTCTRTRQRELRLVNPPKSALGTRDQTDSEGSTRAHAYCRQRGGYSNVSLLPVVVRETLDRI